MKKIHLLIIKTFIQPFIATFFVVMFVLLMLFLFKYIDDLIGKGVEWTVIAELLWFVSATNVAMALPLAILLSSIMTFGNLGEHYELVAIKAAGISLRRAMYPLLIFIGFLASCAFLFTEYMLPVANLKMGSLLYDIKNTKASFLVEEGIFNSSIPGYAIRVDKKDKDERTLHGITIYNHNNGKTGSIIMAKDGEMYKSNDNNYLIIKLKDGVQYEESSGQNGMYNPRQRLIRTYFKESAQYFDLSSFNFKRENQDNFRKHHMMLNSSELSKGIDSLNNRMDSISSKNFESLKNSYSYYQNMPLNTSSNTVLFDINKIPKSKERMVLERALQESNILKTGIDNQQYLKAEDEKQWKNFSVEYQRKFTIPFSCLVLFLIGAPMGAIIRKGGLGMPLVICVLFFLAYHILSTIMEKSAKEGDLNPVIGMWTAIVVFGLSGIYLTYKATTDSAIFDIELYKSAIKRLSWFRLKPKKE